MLFPEQNYQSKNVQGLPIKALKRNYTKQADELLTWLETGCFDALSKQYLKTLTLGIYKDPKNPQELYETYSFSFSYPDNGQYCFSVLVSGKEEHSRVEITKETTQMIRRLLVLTQSMEPLSDNSYLTMKLEYYDSTPAEYEPPCFKAAGADFRTFFNEPQSEINMGTVQTPYHVVQLKVDTLAGVRANAEYQVTKAISDTNSLSAVKSGHTQESDNCTPKANRNLAHQNANLSKLSSTSTQSNLNLKDDIFPSQNTGDLIDQLRNGSNDTVDRNIDLELSKQFSECTQIIGSQKTIVGSQRRNLTSILPRNDSVKSCSLSKFLDCSERMTRSQFSEIANKENTDKRNSNPGVKRKSDSQIENIGTDEKVVSAAKKVGSINCPCSCGEDYDRTFKCKNCKMDGHLPCYGFIDKPPSSILCVDCKHTKLNATQQENIKDLFIFRKALNIMLEKTPNTVRGLADMMCAPFSTSSAMRKKLQDLGFITVSAKSKKVEVVKSKEFDRMTTYWFSETPMLEIINPKTKKRARNNVKVSSEVSIFNLGRRKYEET
jgi:meiosis-specific protein HOP1